MQPELFQGRGAFVELGQKIIKNDEQNPKMGKIRAFFPQNQGTFLVFKKGQGSSPPQLCTWRKMKIGDYLSTYVTKIHVSGSAFCIYCNKPLVSGNTGKKGLFKHATKSTEHLSSKENYFSPTLLPLHWRKTTSESSSEIGTCTPLAHALCCSRKCPHHCHMPFVEREYFASIFSVSDHKHHLEAYVLSFVAENSLLLSVIPKLMEFSQFLSRDPKALSKLQMNQTAASYKLKHGLSVYVRKKVVECMKKYPFSINIDECTSSNSQNVFSILKLL